MEFLAVIAFAVVVVIVIVSEMKKKNDNNDGFFPPNIPNINTQPQNTAKPEFVLTSDNSSANIKTVSVQLPVSQAVEGFDENAETENIKNYMAKYIAATGQGNNGFDALKDFCAKSVITTAQFEAMKAKVSYSDVKVTKVAFTRYIVQAQEVSIFGLAFAEMNMNNGKMSTPYNCTYSFKYSYVYRENTNRKTLKCPHCGAPVSEYEAQRCEFCGEKLPNMLMERSWVFTEITRTENRIKYTG